MSTDELTAEERAYFDEYCGPLTTKLLRLYDAALARAEAAEKTGAEVLESYLAKHRALYIAESRLAEATALLEDANHHSMCEVDYTEDIVPWQERYQAFLSATPAQAAEPEHDSESGVGPVQDHPDTIALRECRAESQKRLDATNAMREALESARAERDTALARIAEQNAELAKYVHARDRIAELEHKLAAHEELNTKSIERFLFAETRIAELRANEEELSNQLEESHAENNSLKTRIARAVAELDKMAPGDPRRDRAREALR